MRPYEDSRVRLDWAFNKAAKFLRRFGGELEGFGRLLQPYQISRMQLPLARLLRAVARASGGRRR